ncbi:ABC-type multidrug transport system fused ATPase/permease subunit [Actinoplanes campanulatus]|uniref:ABC-type multidrug transport system fused ATPase/permease subunit n=1 Tax=Actinoplanes campanulatus TaxID=113559 RepID=A0A7W5FJ25_9ACTN|nr:ABC transporter ATP-binding protein [Actinoplanes campanulatus]MBB3100284.1 ABC-type multidrug transport system fused ATPase/permease subunit [Actinoplanes campanulatus]GGN44074.1 multidrug ABC transporter ATP-binding protein [Actinoplanes campanulatus]GID40914.1 multidrug ABC transporter ATP-binding protein [Actinoplanes campanulatus]
MLWQAPAEPPDVWPFEVRAGDSSGRFVARVIFSLPRVTIPAMLLAVVWQVGESAVPVVMGVAIDRALATGDAGQLVMWIGVLVALYVALTAAARLTNRLNAYAIQLLQHRLRATLSTRVLHPGGGLARAPDGEVVSVMTNDVARLANAGLLVVLPIARIAAIGFIAASLLVTHWPLGVAVLLGTPAAVWLMGVLSERLSRDTREYQGLLAGTVGRAADLVAGYRVIKGVRAEAEATRRYRQASRETLVGAQRNVGLLGRFLVGSGIVNGVFVAAVTGLAGWFTVNGQLSIGGLITAVGLTQALMPQMQSIASASIPNLASARASAARILDALRNTGTETVTPAPGDGTPPEVTPVPVLDVSVSGALIRVRPGELVGVRADDRTATRIADALLNPRAGNDIEVRLDERPAHQLTSAEYRSLVTVAPHRVTLFSGTVRDNLALPARAPEPLEAAVRAAAGEDFAADPDVPVGEGGNRLSGGQRQRVALARALAADAPLLVLHDPTTAVDSVTEQKIAERLRGVRASRSTLLIASSPALLGCCDHIVDLLAVLERPVAS